MARSSDDETTPLVERPELGNPNEDNRHNRCLLIAELLVVLLFAALVGVGYVFHLELETLENEFSSQQGTIEILQNIVTSQADIISQLNTTVANQQVIAALQLMGENLTNTTNLLTNEVTDLEENVTQRLNATVTYVNETVTEAREVFVEEILEVNSAIANLYEQLAGELDVVEDAVSAQIDSSIETFNETVQAANDNLDNEVTELEASMATYITQTQDEFSLENDFMVYEIAGTVTLLSCMISMWHMSAHLRKFNKPSIQRKILAILWMPPIYAVTSWFSLVFSSAQNTLEVIRDFYEAYIVHQFLSFCIDVVGKGSRDAAVDKLAQQVDHLSPPYTLLFCFKPEPYENDRAYADAVLLQCQVFVLQFVLFEPLTTIVNMLCTKFDFYGGGDSSVSPLSPQFWMTLLQNFSVFLAFVGLLKFYHAVTEELNWCRPFAKFLCIKGVVFMTFWQGLVIAALADFTSLGGDDPTEWADEAQDFIICIEMLGFSIAHFYCFPTEEWEEGYRAKHEKLALTESLALGDFMKDVKLILTKKVKTKSRKPKEPTVPEGDEEDCDDTDDDTSRTSSSRPDLESAGLLARAFARSLRNIDTDDDSELFAAKERIVKSSMMVGRISKGTVEIDDPLDKLELDYIQENESVELISGDVAIGRDAALGERQYDSSRNTDNGEASQQDEALARRADLSGDYATYEDVPDIVARLEGRPGINPFDDEFISKSDTYINITVPAGDDRRAPLKSASSLTSYQNDYSVADEAGSSREEEEDSSK